MDELTELINRMPIWQLAVMLFTSVITILVTSATVYLTLKHRSRLQNGVREQDSPKRDGDDVYSPRALTVLKHLLTLANCSGEEQENILGDLLEEFTECHSKVRAHYWLYKQVLKSALPLIYKNLKSRLASYFGERIR